MPTYGQNSAHVPFTWLPLPLHLCAARAHALSTARSSRHLPPSLLAQAHVAPTQCMAIKGGPHVASRPHQRPLSASGNPSPSRSPLFSVTPSVPSHLTPPLSPCAGPGALPELGVAPRTEGPTPSPPLSSDAVDSAGELRISVARPPHYELVLSTVSGRCTVVHGRCLCSPSRRPPPPVPRSALCASSSRQSNRCTR
jgi:hypothetical protein